MTLIDDPVWNLLRKNLRKILYNVNLGIHELADISVANGLLEMFFHADEELIRQEAYSYVEKYPEFRPNFALEMNHVSHS